MGQSMAGLTAIILAAGESTRLKSKKSKVLHQIGGQRCIDWVVNAVKQAGIKEIIVVLGKNAEAIKSTLPPQVKVVEQKKALGTGHAVSVAWPMVGKQSESVVVCCGDTPLLTATTFRQLIKRHQKQKAHATLLTTCLNEPFGYGRIIRDPDHAAWVKQIVEEKEASANQKRINEVNSGVYCFNRKALGSVINKINNHNSKGEYYLTDAIALLNQSDKAVSAYQLTDPGELLGINTRQELVKIGALLNQKIIAYWLNNGVTIIDPATTWIEGQVRIGQDTIIEPGTQLKGETKIGQDCVIGPFATVASSRIGDATEIRQSVVAQAIVGSRVKIGPFAHLRPGNKISDDVKIGNFIEINRSQISSQVKIGHLGYIGDTTIGKEVNIGAGTIVANYDGVKKHQTQIGEKSFIGSGSVLVAPNKIGKGSLTGAGAVVKSNSNFPAGSVVVGVPARVIKKRKLSS